MVTDLAAVLFHAGRSGKRAQHAAPLQRQKLEDHFYSTLGGSGKRAQHAAPLQRHQKEWFPLSSFALATQKNLVMKTAAAIEAGATPSIIKTNVSGIGVAGAIVTARGGVGAGVQVASGHAAPSVLHCAAVKIALVDRLESLLALRGVNANGIDQAEAQGLLRFKDRGATARKQHCADTHCRAGSRADSRPFAPVSGCTDQSTEARGAANGRRVLAWGR